MICSEEEWKIGQVSLRRGDRREGTDVVRVEDGEEGSPEVEV